MERYCKNCDYSYWTLDGAGDEVDYVCIRDIYPKSVSRYNHCDQWCMKGIKKVNIPKIFLTSDLHFGHDREFLFKPRGFENINIHDEEIIRRWNEVVNPEDEVYILGDLMLNDSAHGMECLRQLVGKKHIIRGNHDTDSRLKMYAEITDDIKVAEMLTYKKYHFYLSHYPTLTANLEKENLHQCMINLFGHTHSKEKFYNDIPFMYNVAMDANDCTPVSLDDIIERCQAKVQECKDML